VTSLLEALRGDSRSARIGRYALAALVYWLAVRTFLFSSASLLVHGASIGILYGLMAVGLILVYRTNRVINFAVAAIGAVPSILALILLTSRDVPYPVVAVIAVVGGAGIGALVDVVIIRRFATAPRLLLTVATLGVSQALAGVALLIPIWLVGDMTQQVYAETPWTSVLARDGAGSPLVRGDQVFALVTVVGITVALELFFRRTRLGIALRASADNADRALLLGIPVRRVQTTAWMLAGLFGALTIFLRGPLTGVPVDGTLGPGVLLYALAAAAIAKFDNVPLALTVGVAVGVLEQASVAATGTSNLSYALMLAVVVVALLFHRASLSRAFATGQSSWQAVREFRPIPLELRGLREVRVARLVAVAAVVAVAVAAPSLVSAGQLGNLTLIPLYAIVAVSMVVLSGWAGQVSIGQFGLVGVGAAVAGGLAANHNVDFFVALVLGCLAGGAISVVLGLPAVRVPSVYLAVVTLAFAGAMQFYFLDSRYVLHRLGVLPTDEAARIDRPWLWQGIDLGNDRTFYFVCLVFLLLSVLAARSLRRYRSGRVFIASRDNARAAHAYGINLARTRLTAFAIAGAIASLAGVLMAYQQQAVDPSSYGVTPSIEIFIVAVIGGLTSLGGAVAATVVIEWVRLFGTTYLFDNAHLLVTGPGLLVVLMFLPGGFAEAFFRLRDGLLRRVARRHAIDVPSLLADRGDHRPTPEEDAAIEEAASHVGELEPVGSGKS
jgi:branched-chain amino acid transport system permease protein